MGGRNAFEGNGTVRAKGQSSEVAQNLENMKSKGARVYGEEVGWAILQMRTLKAKGGELSKVSQFLFCQLKERCIKEITLPFPKNRQVLMPPNTVFPSIFWQIGLISPPNSLHYLETLAILMTIIS